MANNLGSVAKSLLGNQQMLKCIVDDDTYVFCSCVAQILQNLDIQGSVDHVINTAVQAQHKAQGCSCKTLLALIDLWLKHLQILLEQGIPISVIIEGFRQGLVLCVEYLDTLVIPLQTCLGNNSKQAGTGSCDNKQVNFPNNELQPSDDSHSECCSNDEHSSAIRKPMNGERCVASDILELSELTTDKVCSSDNLSCSADDEVGWYFEGGNTPDVPSFDSFLVDVLAGTNDPLSHIPEPRSVEQNLTDEGIFEKIDYKPSEQLVIKNSYNSQKTSESCLQPELQDIKENLTYSGDHRKDTQEDEDEFESCFDNVAYVSSAASKCDFRGVNRLDVFGNLKHVDDEKFICDNNVITDQTEDNDCRIKNPMGMKSLSETCFPAAELHIGNVSPTLSEGNHKELDSNFSSIDYINSKTTNLKNVSDVKERLDTEHVNLSSASPVVDELPNNSLKLLEYKKSGHTTNLFDVTSELQCNDKALAQQTASDFKSSNEHLVNDNRQKYCNVSYDGSKPSNQPSLASLESKLNAVMETNKRRVSNRTFNCSRHFKTMESTLHEYNEDKNVSDPVRYVEYDTISTSKSLNADIPDLGSQRKASGYYSESRIFDACDDGDTTDIVTPTESHKHSKLNTSQETIPGFPVNNNDYNDEHISRSKDILENAVFSRCKIEDHAEPTKAKTSYSGRMLLNRSRYFTMATTTVDAPFVENDIERSKAGGSFCTSHNTGRNLEVPTVDQNNILHRTSRSVSCQDFMRTVMQHGSTLECENDLPSMMKNCSLSKQNNLGQISPKLDGFTEYKCCKSDSDGHCKNQNHIKISSMPENVRESYHTKQDSATSNICLCTKQSSEKAECVKVKLTNLVSGLSHGVENVVPLVTDMILSQINDSESFPSKFRLDLSRVHTCCCVGPLSEATCLVDGLLVDVQLQQLTQHASKSRPSYRGLLINGDIRPAFRHRGHKQTEKTQIICNTLPVSSAKQQWLEAISTVLHQLDVNLVLVKGTADDYFLDYCAAKDILVFLYVPYKVLLAVGETTQADIATYVTECTQDSVAGGIVLQPWQPDWMDRMTENNKSYVAMKIDNCLVQTALFCHPSETMAHVLEDQFWHCAYRLRNAFQLQCIIPGGGVSELHCISMLQKAKESKIHSSHSETELYLPEIYEAVISGFREFINNLAANSSAHPIASYSEISKKEHQNEAESAMIKITKKLEQCEYLCEDIDVLCCAGCNKPSGVLYDDYHSKAHAWWSAYHVVSQILQSDMEVVTGLTAEISKVSVRNTFTQTLLGTL